MSNAAADKILLERQRRASEPDASAWVTANAGAGKTHVLTSRVARLLLAGNDPARLLCLTYTKAAAAEMKDRLFKMLGAWCLQSDDALSESLRELEGRGPDKMELARARRLFAAALETPGGLKVQTIHAFCERLLSRFPIEAGLTPPFTVVNEPSAAELLRQARDRVIALADNDPVLASAFERLVVELDELSFSEALEEIVGNRRAGLRGGLQSEGFDNLLSHIRRTLDVASGETVDTLKRAAATLSEASEKQLRQVLKALGTSTTQTDRDMAAALDAFLLCAERHGAYSDYCRAFLTAKDEPRKRLITQNALKAMPGALVVLEAQQKRVVDYMSQLARVETYDLSEAMVRVAAHVKAQYEKQKSNRALLDYDDLISKSVDLLSHSMAAPWVLFKLDGGIDHILIDEAQDTSPDQWEVISAIASEFFAGYGAEPRQARSQFRNPDRRTVFAVGDEKQSIYSFQGADPAGFARWQETFGNAANAVNSTFNLVELPYSFRSVPAVLTAVDATFGGELPLEGLTSVRMHVEHIAHREGGGGLVELWPLVEPVETQEPDTWDAPLDLPSRDSPSRKLAERIARQIKHWVTSGERLVSKGRAIVPGDIMVLVRRRNAFVDDLIRALKACDIAVAGADRLQLTAHIAIKDLIALGAFVLQSEDDLTLAALLKSPLCALSEEDLFTLAHGREASLWAALESRAKTTQFMHAQTFLTRARNLADTAPPFEFYAHVLSAMGGRALLTGRLGHEANDPIDEFLNLALAFEREHAPSLQAFLHWVQSGASEIIRDLDRGHGEVRVMTVHGAKGLESDIVILPDTTALPNKGAESPLISSGDALLWRRSKVEPVQAAIAERDLEQLHEYRRLLYVAMTRARDRLYICGYRGKSEPPPDCWYSVISNKIKPLAQPFETDDGPVWRLISEQKPSEEIKKDKTVEAREVVELPDWARRTAPLERAARGEAPSRLFGAKFEAPSPLAQASDIRFLRGRLIHRLLQSLPDLAAGERRAAGERFLLQKLELDASQRTEILAAALRVLDDPAFAAVFAEGSRAEVPVAGTIRGLEPAVHINGQIDRLAVTNDDVFIVDYKTDQRVPARAESVSGSYVGQLATYRALLAPLFPGRTIRCALLWTSGPKLMEIEAFALDAAIAALKDRGVTTLP